ncbi:MAG: response regulator [Candidatus Omnitrophica bacterium]|nr:response regulator [Candidatus Omnitrophota bacterium]MDD5574066.1 response regulator [Candidatus Omnitrophota bacterium]
MLERVFIVEEDVKARDFLYEMISRIGCGVLTLPSGSALLELLKNERPTLIIVSDQKGDDSGFSLVKKIREFDKDVKIIMLGFLPSGPFFDAFIKEAGVSAFLPKNFEDPEITKAIVSVLRQERVRVPFETRKVGSRILVVDDELEGRETVAHFLNRKGFDAETASSGEECLEKFRLRPFDLVLLDVTMSGMDGLLTLKRIRNINPRAKVVMVTALQAQDIVDQATAMGACDYLIKPFNFSVLEAMLSSILCSGGARSLEGSP